MGQTYIPLEMNTLDNSSALTQEDYERINRVMSEYKSEKHESYESAYNTTKDTLTNSFVGQFYFASLSVVGLFIVFRMVQSYK
jgi:hypothetical protein